MYCKSSEGDYLLAVKNNQASLYQNIEDLSRFLKTADYNEKIDTDHGRIYTLKRTIITDLGHIENPDKWEKLNVLIRMESERCDKATGNKEYATRYYIATRPGNTVFLVRCKQK